MLHSKMHSENVFWLAKLALKQYKFTTWDLSVKII